MVKLQAMQVFVALYVKAVGIWLAVLAVVFLAALAAGCVRGQSPLNEMMALTAQGHVACARQGVLVRGRECRR